jgi:hypothetical protein
VPITTSAKAIETIKSTIAKSNAFFIIYSPLLRCVLKIRPAERAAAGLNIEDLG